MCGSGKKVKFAWVRLIHVMMVWSCVEWLANSEYVDLID